jgi:hypothetical protein
MAKDVKYASFIRNTKEFYEDNVDPLLRESKKYLYKWERCLNQLVTKGDSANLESLRMGVLAI